ncbi:hypothetical protein ACFX14_013410 [Malus domestica]
MFPCVCVYIFRFEKVNVRRLRSNAKIIGKIICGGGAIYMTFIKGTKLLNTQLPIPPKSLLGLEGQNLTLGYLFFIVNTCCASFWVIQQKFWFLQFWVTSISAYLSLFVSGQSEISVSETGLCYDPLVSAFWKDGRLDLAIEFLDYMISDDCLPDIVNYNTILAALCKSGKADQALQIFKNFDEVGCPSNADAIVKSSCVLVKSTMGDPVVL